MEASRYGRQAKAAQASAVALLASQARADELATRVEVQQIQIAEETSARQLAEAGWREAEAARTAAERRVVAAVASQLEAERGVTADVEALRRLLEVEAVGRQGKRERDRASERAQLQQLLGAQGELKVEQAERQRVEEALASEQRAEVLAAKESRSLAMKLKDAQEVAATAAAAAAAAAAELLSTCTSASAERENAATEVREQSEKREEAQRAAEGMVAENGALLKQLQEATEREVEASEAAQESQEEIGATQREVERLRREVRDVHEALARAGPRVAAAELVAQIAISEIAEVEDARAAVAVREANEAAAAAKALDAATVAVRVETAARAEAEVAMAREVEVREVAEARVAALVAEAEAGRATRALRSTEGVVVALAATQTDWLGGGEEEEARLRDPLLEMELLQQPHPTIADAATSVQGGGAEGGAEGGAATGSEVATALGEAALSALIGELYAQLLMQGPTSASATVLPPLSLHVQQDFLRRYGLKRRADEQLHLLIVSVKTYTASNRKVALFGRFTGLTSPLPHATFLFYLRLLSGVQAELGRCLGAEWVGSAAQPLLLPLEQAQQVLSSAFRGVLPQDALSRLADDLARLARNTEAAAPEALDVEMEMEMENLLIEMEDLLMLGIDAFVAEHQRTNSFLEVFLQPSVVTLLLTALLHTTLLTALPRSHSSDQ